MKVDGRTNTASRASREAVNHVCGMESYRLATSRDRNVTTGRSVATSSNPWSGFVGAVPSLGSFTVNLA